MWVAQDIPQNKAYTRQCVQNSCTTGQTDQPRRSDHDFLRLTAQISAIACRKKRGSEYQDNESRPAEPLDVRISSRIFGYPKVDIAAEIKKLTTIQMLITQQITPYFIKNTLARRFEIMTRTVQTGVCCGIFDSAVSTLRIDAKAPLRSCHVYTYFRNAVLIIENKIPQHIQHSQAQFSPEHDFNRLINIVSYNESLQIADGQLSTTLPK